MRLLERHLSRGHRHNHELSRGWNVPGGTGARRRKPGASTIDLNAPETEYIENYCRFLDVNVSSRITSGLLEVQLNQEAMVTFIPHSSRGDSIEMDDAGTGGTLGGVRGFRRSMDQR